jgi:hypothetical protein
MRSQAAYSEAFLEALWKESSLYLHQTPYSSRHMNELGLDPLKAMGNAKMLLGHILAIYCLGMDLILTCFAPSAVPPRVTKTR